MLKMVSEVGPCCRKRMYFVGVLAKEDFQFAPYYYGPYSSIVADQIGALCEAGFVSEQVPNHGLAHTEYSANCAGLIMD